MTGTHILTVITTTSEVTLVYSRAYELAHTQVIREVDHRNGQLGGDYRFGYISWKHSGICLCNSDGKSTV